MESGDTRLPESIAECSVSRLLKMSYGDLYATPGMGHKRLSCLLNVLRRVATGEPSPMAPSIIDTYWATTFSVWFLDTDRSCRNDRSGIGIEPEQSAGAL
jgi:hypothetical protein